MQYLFYHGQVSPAGVRNVEALLAAAHREGEAEVTLCIASNGGDVTAGVGLYNYIKMLPITVHTHATGPCGSIAATVFLAGTRRTAASLSLFITHAATFIEGPLIGQASPNTDLISRPFRDILKWDDNDIAARFGAAEMRYSPDEAKELGIIESIIDVRIGHDDTMVNVNFPA